MGGIFVSHSSLDNDAALKLCEWLEGQGWGRAQVFLDITNIKSGDRWREVLNGMNDSEAVIICLSDNWLRSDECKREFTQAEERGKAILPIFVAPVTLPIPRFITDVQIGDTSEAGFQKLRDQLFARRITPHSFPWPPPDEPTRSVYRGLSPLDVKDAAIFFGRDADIARALDEIRRMRNGARERVFVVLGASGAGKSSFLRAGLVARLKREEADYVVLPVIRPERAALTGPQGLAAAFGATNGTPTNGAALAAAFAALRAPVEQRLASRARAAGESIMRSPTIVLAIDQAEELFGQDNAEAAKFREIVEDAIAADGNAIAITTIRSDAYSSLQNAWMPESQFTFSLPVITAGSFKEIIEGPARLARPPLNIEPALTQNLLSDLETVDGLPLLAFTLARLQQACGEDGALTLADYQNVLGGLAGAIESAVATVLGAHPEQTQLAMARRLFVPRLVRVSEDDVKRRIALRSEIPDELRVLADKFVEQRLLVADKETLEIAHESILRQWPALVSWIAEERGALTTLESVRAAAREWAARSAAPDRGQSWLVHRNERLNEAIRITRRVDFAATVDPTMRDYLSACRSEERRAAGVRRRWQIVAATFALAIVGLGYAYTQRAVLEPLAISWLDYRSVARASSELRAAPPGTEFQDCRHASQCPVMVVIPGGTFLMGDAPQQRRTEIATLAVSKFEITFDNWAACVAAGGCSANRTPSDSSWGRRDRPVINVSWNDALAYVTWLSSMTGQNYRLLREDEWEYAARAAPDADVSTPWSFGDDVALARQYAWTYENAGRQTHPVGQLQPNGFGLYDMHGNVWEWVEDCHVEEPVADAADPALDAASSDEICSSRVLRGGSWIVIPVLARSGVRNWLDPAMSGNGFGFRVARTITPARSD